MEEYMNTDDLKEMKEQIAILNRKLNKEVEVNEKLLRKVLKNKVSGMNWYVGIMNSLALLLIPFYFWACPYLGISWWFCSASSIFLFTAIMHGHFTHKRLQAKNLMNEDLLVVSRKLKEIRLRYANWQKYSLPFVAILLCWLYVEFYLAGRGNIISFVITIIVSVWAAIKSYRRLQRTLDEIQQEIDELMRE